MGPAVLGPSLYYYGDIEKNKTLVRDDVPLTHKTRKKRDDLDAKTKIQCAAKREGIVLGSQEFNLQDEELSKCFSRDNQTQNEARIVSSSTFDNRKEKKRKRQSEKYGRRRTNTYDCEVQKSKSPPEIPRHGNSDGETDGFDDDILDAFITDFKFNNGKIKNGEDLPLLGLGSTNASCPVALADRSRAYLCKNLDLEADDMSLTYDLPNARRSVTYSNAGTFPMPDVKRGGHYDQPETGNIILSENDWHTGATLDNGVTRSRSWYLCCPGSGLAGGNNDTNTVGQDGTFVNSEHVSNQGAAIISAPSPGENQYLHLAAVSSLKNEVLELSARLHAAQRDRDNARDSLCASQSECARLREALSSQARCSEERITELHGVIAELRRACVARERAAIPETHEDDSEVETSYRDNSVTGNSDQTTSACDADETASMHNETDTPASPAALPVPDFPSSVNWNIQQNMSKQQAMSCASNDNSNQDCVKLNLAPADSTSFDEEDAIEVDRRLRNRRRASPRSPRRMLNNDNMQHSSVQPHNDDNEHYNSHAINRQSPCIRGSVAATSNASPQTKMASRVRLRRTHEDGRLTGKEICQEGVYSSSVAEHLTRGGTEDCALEGEERFIARIDRLEADNMLLAVTLKESKEYADRLSLTCAQCSAEAGALRLALAAADRAVEAYDVLLALAETSHPNQESGSNAGKLRQATERVARQLLARLDWEAANGGLGGGSVCIGPWADHAAMLQYQSVNEGKAWSMEEEERLRGHVSRLKRERTVAASGAQTAQWPLQDEGTEDNLSGILRDGERNKCVEPGDIRKMDMETAVLMQEVMSLREERAELKARLRSLRPTGSRHTHTSSSGGDEGESERRLLEALARENTLKTRLQRLMASVHQAGRATENAEENNKKYSCSKCGNPPANKCEEQKEQCPPQEVKQPPVNTPNTETQPQDIVSSEAVNTEAKQQDNGNLVIQPQSAISCSDIKVVEA